MTEHEKDHSHKAEEQGRADTLYDEQQQRIAQERRLYRHDRKQPEDEDKPPELTPANPD